GFLWVFCRLSASFLYRSDFGVRIFRPWYKSLRILPLQSCFESYCYLHLTGKVTPSLAELRPRDYYRASCSESYGKRRVSCGVRCGASKKETIRSHVTATATNLRNRPDPSTHFPNCSKKSEERRVGKECRSRWSP